MNHPQRDQAAAHGSPGKYRRLPPSPAEQQRRQAWGRKWGAMVKEATRSIWEGKR